MRINLRDAFEALKTLYPEQPVSISVQCDNYRLEDTGRRDRVRFEAFVHAVDTDRCDHYEGASLEEVLGQVRSRLAPPATDADAVEV